MAVNRFSTPVENQYISQYVPIPFEQLYALGKEYNNAVDKSIAGLTQYNKEWQNFKSPIKKDVEDYNKIVMNPQIKSLVEQATANPDNLKSANFRRSLQTAINNVDYASLNKLKSSAENAYNYLNTAKQLAASGRYNKDWDTVDFDTYSTLGSDKIFDEVSPIQYKNLQEIVNPYVKDIKETFYKGVDPNSGARMPFTNWMAVTEKDIRDILQSRYNDIVNTPQGRMWYRDIARNIMAGNPNATAQDIDEAFTSAMVDASRQYIGSKPIQDTLGFNMWKYSTSLPENQPTATKSLTQKIEDRGQIAYQNMKTMLFNSVIKPEDVEKAEKLELEYENALSSNDTVKQKQIMQEYSNLQSKYGLKDYVQSTLFKNFTGGSMQDDINFVASSIITPYAGTRETQTALQNMPNSFESKDDIGLGITVTNIGDYETLDEAIMRIGNSGLVSGPSKKVQDYLKNNRISSKTVGIRGAISTVSGNLNVTQQAIKREDLLPMITDDKGNKYSENETDPKKINQYYKNLDKLMKEAGYVKISANRLKGYSTKEEFNEDHPLGKGHGDISKQYTGGGVYYTKDYVNRLPMTKESGSEDFNNFYDKMTLSSKDASDTYGTRQYQQAMEYMNNDYFDKQ